MARMLYNLPTDNLAPLATVTDNSIGSEASGSAIANVKDLSAANASRRNNQQAFYLFDFGAPVTIYLPVIINHNLVFNAPTYRVRIKANSSTGAYNSPAWTSPAFNAELTWSNPIDDGHRANIHRDLTGLSGHGAYRYWAVDLISEFVNPTNIVIGEIWLGAVIRNLAHNFSWGFSRREHVPGRTVFRTSGGVTWSTAGYGRQREIEAECETSDAGLQALTIFNRVCRGANGRSAIIVPETPEGAALGGLDAWLARWTVDLDYQGVFTQDNMVRLGFLEDARGIAI
jgi:hypothetical protein